MRTAVVLVIAGIAFLGGCRAPSSFDPEDPAVIAEIESQLQSAMAGAAAADADRVLANAGGNGELTFVTGDVMLGGLETIRARFKDTYAGLEKQEQTVREKRVRKPDDPIERFRPYRGVVLSGSPSLSAFGEDSAYTKAIYELETPIIGFCFGHQEIAKHYGGTVVHGGREWGHADLRIVKRDHPLFKGLANLEPVWMSHYDSVTAVGPDFEEFGYTMLGPDATPHRFAAIGSDRLRRYGFQFHPEVDDTMHGDEMIANFVLGICGCTPSWTMERYVEEETERLRAQVGERSVFLLASGAIESPAGNE